MVKNEFALMLLLPLASAPTVTVNGPRRSVSSAKFLKFTRGIEVINGLPSTYRAIRRGVRHVQDTIR